MNFAKKENSAELNGLSTVQSLGWMLESKNHYAADMVFLPVALCTHRRIGLEASYDVHQMSVQYIDSMNKELVDHRKVRLVKRQLSELQSETEEFKRVVQRALAPHYPVGPCTLKRHLLDHLVEELKGFQSMPLTDAAFF